MIKDLIVDIAYDKISLAQALTRAKLIANQVQNKTFKDWLSKELNGYKYDDLLLPKYRKIPTDIELTAELPFGQIHKFPLLVDKNISDEIKDMLFYHRATEPIYVIEQNISAMKKGKGYLTLPAGMIQDLADWYPDIEARGGVLRRGTRLIGKAQLQNITELTKQKLLDTLQELDHQFPDIDNKYVPNDENQREVQNIITNNIFGNNNPLNVASGNKVEQTDINLSVNTIDKSQLKDFGISENEINDLEKIDQVHPQGTSERKQKIMGWLGKVTASMTARGISDQIPRLIDYIGHLM